MSNKRRASSEPQPPPAKKLKLISIPETAAEEDGFKLIRSLDLTLLRPETIVCLKKHTFDSLQKDPHAKVVVRSGSLSTKCELVRSTDPIRPFKIVAKVAIPKGECVAVYMGSLIEASRCTEQNIWQYEIPASLFPPKKGIPTLVLDASRSANECRFFHAEEWYRGKSANVDHSIIWDVHERVPQIIYRTKRNIVAGEDLLMKWGDTGVKYKEDFESNNKKNNDNTRTEVDASSSKKKQTGQVVTKEKRATQSISKEKQDEIVRQNQKKREEEKRRQIEENNKNQDEQKRKDAAKKDSQRKLDVEITTRNEAARHAREQEIIRTKQILVQTKRIEENHERIQKILEEKRIRDLHKPPQMKVNYATTKVTKKIRSEEKSTESDQIENTGEDRPLEVEELAPPRPTVEIDFFSQKEAVTTVINKPSSISALNDVMFDLNDSLALSDEEEIELENLVYRNK